MAESFEVKITPRAQQRFEDILDYLIEKYSFEVAKKVGDRIIQAIYSLEKAPHRGAIAKGIISKNHIVYRRILAGLYRIIYFIEEDSQKVFVVEIHHSKQGDARLYEDFE